MILTCLLCLLALIADRMLKIWVSTHLLERGLSVFQNWLGGVSFSLEYVTNRGAAWGVLAQFDHALLWMRLLLIAGLALYICIGKVRGQVKELPLALILTGALGNVVDHFLYGHVIDMLHFSFWGHSFAVFNIADMTIFCGVALFLFLSYRVKPCSGSPPHKKKV